MFWGILPFSLEIDQTFIGAILTAIGYSINDKVVIFDRVREFFSLYPKRNKKVLFNDSLNTTLARTINTSLSTLIVLLCIFILGGDSIRSFAFAMILGVVFGTLSSLFVASPIAYMLMKHKKETEQAVVERNKINLLIIGKNYGKRGNLLGVFLFSYIDTKEHISRPPQKSIFSKGVIHYTTE